MQGTLFCRDRKSAEFILHGLRRTSLSLELASNWKSFERDQLLFQSSVFVFHGSLSREDISLIQLIQKIKPSACLVILDPADMRCIDDFDLVFSKPFSYPHLSLLVQKKMCEKRDRFMRHRLRFGDITLHVLRRTLTRGDKTISLSNKEFSLMQYFFLNPGRIISRSDIMDTVWDRHCPISTNTVDVHVSRLRGKLEKCHAAAFLRTVPCFGYQWLLDAI